MILTFIFHNSPLPSPFFPFQNREYNDFIALFNKALQPTKPLLKLIDYFTPREDYAAFHVEKVIKGGREEGEGGGEEEGRRKKTKEKK